MSNVLPLLQLMERLRDPKEGCPWDRTQTFASIAPYTIEEAYEVADAISREDMADLASELGDLLFHVVFHTQMAKEANLFDFEQVVTGIVEKMTRRHPHVFAGERIESITEQSTAWETQKTSERKSTTPQDSLMDQVTKGLPSMLRAIKLQKKAAEVKFDWTDALSVLKKLREEIGELEDEIRAGNDQHATLLEMGDLLFSCMNLARHLHIDPDSALREANGKFERRFRAMEKLLASQDKTIGTSKQEELDQAWERIKSEEQQFDIRTC